MKPTKQLLLISIFSVVPSAQAGLQPLLDSDLTNQSLYASSYITMGARTTAGGNIQSVTAITLAANATIGGNIEAGTTATLGADAGADGYIEAGTTATFGAAVIVGGYTLAGTTATLGAAVNIEGDLVARTTVTIDAGVEVWGDVLAGSTVTIGAGSIFRGDVDAGTTTTIGAGVRIDGTLTANSSKVVPASPIVQNQEDLIASVQKTLKELGTGTELVSLTFGINHETLEAGIYSTRDYLTIAADKTLTLDGKGVDGTWVFNIANYLTFAAGAKVILKDVTENSSILWNVLGDATGSAGYTSLGAGAEAIGYIFSRGYVLAGANTLIAGIGNDCGGAFSATNYIEFGADSVIGMEGCVSNFIPPNKVPSIIWLF
ncbi:ice-binding family protein [Neptunomonas antarctica]|uniref:Uncharacterized protein n=1 Tax=Neptunomonas antarctica TaxID=619304 RepID=A0A1N7IZW9_9GAMM|nr:ice-binding family protein [Neptunomonas antarctica]SIS42610.1 Protein of unknown function [Neptunomonas antarctica]